MVNIKDIEMFNCPDRTKFSFYLRPIDFTLFIFGFFP